MSAPSHLRSLQALELAVRTGTFQAAAERLAITPAAVGQRVKALEDYLGVELLVRGRAGVRPAPELREALPYLREAFRALDQATRALDLQRGGELHIAAASDFAALWLTPRLPAFREAYPHIRICLNGEGDTPVRLGRVDCEIRYDSCAPDEETDLLFRQFVMPVSSRANIARVEGLDPMDRLEGFPLLHCDFYKDDPAQLGWRAWIAAHGMHRSDPERGMRFRRITHALDAVLADAGFTMCGLALIAPLIDSGDVAPIYPVSMGRWSEHGFIARFREDWRTRRHVRMFREWLCAQAAETAAWQDRAAQSL